MKQRDQLHQDHDALRARLRGIPAQTERETDALRRRYADPTARWFPAAVTFLVPASLAHAGAARSRCAADAGRDPRRPASPSGRDRPGRRPAARRMARPAQPGRPVPDAAGAHRSVRARPGHGACRHARPAPAGLGRVADAPDLLGPAWHELVLGELLRLPGSPPVPTRSTLPQRSPAPARTPCCTARSPAAAGAARLHLYRRPAGTPLTTAPGNEPAPSERAAQLCRDTGSRWRCSPTTGCGCSYTPGRASRPAPRFSTPTCGWRSRPCCARLPPCWPRRVCSPTGRRRRRRLEQPGRAVRPQRRRAHQGHHHPRQPGPQGGGAVRRRAGPAGPGSRRHPARPGQRAGHLPRRVSPS